MTDADAERRLVEATRESVGVIVRFHEQYKSFRTIYLKRPSPDLSHLPPSRRRIAEQWRRTRIRDLPFSDGLVVYLSLHPDLDHSPVLGLHFLTMAAGMLALVQAAMGKPIRGGIDAGTAIRTHGQLFGAAVVKAYELESETAVWPRILIGDDLVQYLETKLNGPREEELDELNRFTAERVFQTLFKDTDGKWAIDFLGPMFHTVPDLERPLALDRLFCSAYSKSKQALHHWKNENSSERLVAKYQYLCDYIASRAGAWGLPLDVLVESVGRDPEAQARTESPPDAK
jgi:hypothetical protein